MAEYDYRNTLGGNTVETPFLKIGHRGRSGNPRYGENTILSFTLAMRAGANAIEYDVRKTKDGKLVVIHDETVDRTTNGTGKVSDYTYGELLRFDAGYGERIPLFEEALYHFSGHVIQNIELKEVGIAEEVSDILSGIKEVEKHAVVSSFDWDELSVFRLRGIPTALPATERCIRRIGEYAFVTEAIRRGAKTIHTSLLVTTPSLVGIAHGYNINICPWTVNDPKDIARMKEMRVDGIMSDFVERL